MDPLSAFGLACGVIQVVDYSTKVVVKCRELYKCGASSENKELESMANYLTNISSDLKLSSAIPSPQSTSQLYHDDQDLRELAHNCSGTATELVNQLQRLSIQDRPKKRDVLYKAIKIGWKEDTIKAIQRRLEQYRGTLDTRILISLRQHLHLISNRLSNGCDELDGKLQNLIIGIAKNQATFDELKVLIEAENTSSKQHVSQELEKHRKIVGDDESYKRLLESLSFPDIHAREEGIAKAHKETFEWIFDKPGGEVRPWGNFVEWLESGHGTYWISGKAGSGKSTLMSFICQDPRTEAALRVWFGTRDILLPQFFFWSPGTQLQKSLAGLLRSLLYQILDQKPALASYVSPIQHRLMIPTWTEQRLCATLQHLLSDGLEGCCLCIFIDGLDEFHGSWITLLDLIRDLGQTTRVKFCLSSRPHRSFRDGLSSAAMLKLQDLTGPDIRRYVYDLLQQAHSEASQVSTSLSRLESTADTILQKAEGVFLWVHLAVRDQIEGIKDGDTTEQLKERLELLPEEMEGLYGHILRGIDKVYRREVAQYFHLLLHFGGSPLFEIAGAVHSRIDDILLFSADISVGAIRHHCSWVGERLFTTSKGFLEIRETSSRNEWQEAVTKPSLRMCVPLEVHKILEKLPLEQRNDLLEITFHQVHCWVNFLHRTAIEFFEDNEQGKDFLREYAPVNPHHRVLWTKVAHVYQMVIPLRVTDESRHTQDSIVKIIHAVYITERDTGVAQPALMDLLNRSITMLCQRSPGQPSNLHWCRAWGFPVRFASSDTSSDSLLHIEPSFPMSVPRTQRNDEPPNDGILTPYPVDLLGFAAWCGVHKYVEHSLDSQLGLQDFRTADYLLSCAVNGLGLRNMGVPWHLNLIKALLNRRVDPNKKTFSSTVWGSFLRRLHDWCQGTRLGRRDMDFKLHEERGDIELQALNGFKLSSKAWGDTARAFLQNGAHVNEKIWYIAGSSFYEGRELVVNSGPVTLYSYAICLHLSALSVLQHCFAYSSAFSEMADICSASGASYHSECIALSLRVARRGECDWVEMKLSKQQKGQFLHFLEQLLTAPAETSNNDRCDAFELGIEEIYREYDMQQQNDIDCRSHGSHNSAPDIHIVGTEGPSRSAHNSQTEDYNQ